jgi:hypothetical protein
VTDEELLELWQECLHYGSIQAIPKSTYLTREQLTTLLALRELFKRTVQRTQP